jgi:hypothetical protein
VELKEKTQMNRFEFTQDADQRLVDDLMRKGHRQIGNSRKWPVEKWTKKRIYRLKASTQET